MNFVKFVFALPGNLDFPTSLLFTYPEAFRNKLQIGGLSRGESDLRLQYIQGNGILIIAQRFAHCVGGSPPGSTYKSIYLDRQCLGCSWRKEGRHVSFEVTGPIFCKLQVSAHKESAK